MKIEEAKKELIKNKKYVSGFFDNEHCKQSFNDGIDLALDIIDQTEPYQPKREVPQTIFDVIESFDDDVDYLHEHMSRQSEGVREWLTHNERDFYEAWLAYPNITAEKEKLYTVEIPNPNGCNLYLIKLDKEVVITSDLIADVFPDNLKLTEQEIRKDYDWAFRWAKEVTE